MRNDVCVLVVDDGPGLAGQLRRTCRKGLTVLGPVLGVGEAAEVHALGQVDVVIVELDRGDQALAVIAELVSTIPAVRVLGIASSLDPDLAAAVLAAGACGLILVGTDAAALRSAIKQAMAGELVVPDHDLAAIVARMDLARRAACGIDALTGREREVLRLLAEGCSTADIGERLGISTMTVQSHVKNVLAKLGLHSKMDAVRVAWREGLARIPASA